MLSVLLRPLKDPQQLQLQLTTFAAATIGATRGKKNLNKLANDAAAGAILSVVITVKRCHFPRSTFKLRAMCCL